MCGIFFVQSKNGLENVHEDGMKGVLDNFYSFQSRGPDRSKHKRQLLNEEKSINFVITLILVSRYNSG